MTLISTRTILIYDEIAQESDGPKQFVREYDEDADIADNRDDYCVVIPKIVWDDLGQPITITLTIEPGDKLNGDTS